MAFFMGHNSRERIVIIKTAWHRGLTFLEGHNVTTRTVKRDLCIGCGVCAGVCPAGNLTMKWGEAGIYAPVDYGRCIDSCSSCLSCCPFDERQTDEDELGQMLFGDYEGIRHTKETGYYIRAFAGYLNHPEQRLKGASGGLARWFLYELLEKDLVDRVACVVPVGDDQKLFTFELLEKNGLKSSAGSCYYPVEFSGVLKTIMNEDARFAVIGLPCLIKGLRLAMVKQKRLSQRIKFLAGLVCSHTKSSAFAGALIRMLGLEERRVRKIKFRHKLPNRKSTDYGVRVEMHDGTEKVGRMEELIPHAWPYSLFKPNACNYCDDVFAELADVAFMDAWLPEYTKESHGTNLVITRTPEVDLLFKEGAKRGKLFIEEVKIEQVIASQRSALGLKRDGLAHRLWLAEQEGRPYPKKRVKPIRPGRVEKERINALEEIRVVSHQAMRQQRESQTSGLRRYNTLMKRPIQRFKQLRRWGPIITVGRRFMRKLRKGKRLNKQQ
jgi:coenzyme F420 hydrogenase subunit beta